MNRSHMMERSPELPKDVVNIIVRYALKGVRRGRYDFHLKRTATDSNRWINRLLFDGDIRRIFALYGWK